MKHFIYILFIQLVFLQFVFKMSNGQENSNWRPEYIPIPTKWSAQVSEVNSLPEYPRPQMVREGKWMCLNGLWDYKIVDLDQGKPKVFDDKILVPFPVESSLSGVKKSLRPSQNLWYRKMFYSKTKENGQKVFIHFGAVDWECTVFLNDVEIGSHKGGYNKFSFDITKFLKDGGNELIVKVYDPTDRGVGPHGKQARNPANIYYTSCSGIWQTVWLEVVPETFIHDIRIYPNLDSGSFAFKVSAEGDTGSTTAEVIIYDKGKRVASARGDIDNMINVRMANPKEWSPEFPFLYDVDVLLRKGNRVVDKIKSYCGMRKVEVKKDSAGFNRIFINNKYTYNLGVLDQGYWPDGIYTAPTDSALAFDIKVIKAMGFNTIRKHIKIEPDRWYYYADRLGILVWQDFVNPNQSLREGAKAAFENGVRESVDQLFNHPSIISWVLFNEKWGQYDQKRLTEWVKLLDPSRLINGHSGELLYVNNVLRSPSSNAYVSSDIVDVHSYPFPRNAPSIDGKVQVLGEFGGIGVPVEGHFWDDLTTGWGYQGMGSSDTLRKLYRLIMDSLVVLEKQGLSASIYTQPFDVESEQNGLLTYDRIIIKLPLDTIRKFNSKIIKSRNDLSMEYGLRILEDNQQLRYSDRVKLFQAGRRDSLFLRSLNLMSLKNKDTLLSELVFKDYLSLISDTFSIYNLRFILHNVHDPNSYISDFVYRNRSRLNAVLGNYDADRRIMALISRFFIEPAIKNNSSVNWSEIEKSIIPKYGELAEEEIWASKMIFYLDNEDWENFMKYYKLYYTRVLPLTRSKFHVNNMSWYIFLKSDDPTLLKFAQDVMLLDIKRNGNLTVEAFDTYANLLYKTGNREEALIWEKKALDLSKNDPEIKDVYNKMLNNKKTWE